MKPGGAICRAGTAAVLALLLALACRPSLAGVALTGGDPDPKCPDLSLWLRADAGVRDSAGHVPADKEFNGLVTNWSDQSNRHFDLEAAPDRAPFYIMRQAGAGNRPTIAFGGGRVLTRRDDKLHDHANSTTLLVLQIQRSRPQENFVYCVGPATARRETLSFIPINEADSTQGHLCWRSATLNGGEVPVDDPLHFPADSRFAIVTIRSTGEGSSVEVQDGLGDALGSDREMIPQGISAGSNLCGSGYCLGGLSLESPPYSYDGQIAEVMVYNRNLAPTERRAVVSYLRRKYALDVLDALYPQGTQLMQAEDFDGDWMINSHWDQIGNMCLGWRHASTRSQQIDKGIRRSVLIPRPGKYSLWVRALGYGKETALRTIVAGKPLGVTHADGPSSIRWQLAGTADLPAGETEIMVRGEGPGRKVCDAVLISPTVTTLDGVEQVCTLARRLRQMPSPGRLAAVFDDGRRIEGNLVSGWQGSGVTIAGDGGARPGVRYLQFDSAAPAAVSDSNPNPADAPAPQSDALLEFQNGDRMKGTISGFTPAPSQAGQSIGAQLLVQMSQEAGKLVEKPCRVEIEWLRRIVFDTAGPPRRCPPRSLVCRDGRVIAFRAVRFSGEGVSVLTDKGLVKLAYRELAEIVMQPLDAWEAYYRQLAVIDPHGDADIIRLETMQGTVFTASNSRVTAFRKMDEPAAPILQVEPAWSRTPVPVAWSSVRAVWRAPATVVPLSLFAPQQVIERGTLGSSWKWQADRNVAGGDLRSGGGHYLWGFGVHAPAEMTFLLPDAAVAFKSGVGIDGSMGDSGSVVAKVSLNSTSSAPLFQSKPILGSRAAYSTGDVALPRGNSPARQLVLTIDRSDAAGPNAAPLDIGNHADWLEPTLLLDPAKLRAAVEKYRPMK